jgi:hypothetical protein
MNSGGFSKQFVGGIMALVMGIVTIIRMTSSMPRKITEAALYGGNSVYYDGSMMKAPAISNNEYMAMMKRMAELEEKVTVLSVKPVMPPEKEEMLNNALTRVSTLEQELGATKKVLVLLLYFILGNKRINHQFSLQIVNVSPIYFSLLDTKTMIFHHF